MLDVVQDDGVMDLLFLGRSFFQQVDRGVYGLRRIGCRQDPRQFTVDFRVVGREVASQLLDGPLGCRVRLTHANQNESIVPEQVQTL